MSEKNVVSINKFKEMEINDLSDDEQLAEIIKAVINEGAKSVIIMGIADNGEGILAHTPLDSRFHVLGVLESMKQWIFINGLENGELD